MRVWEKCLYPRLLCQVFCGLYIFDTSTPIFIDKMQDVFLSFAHPAKRGIEYLDATLLYEQ